MGHLIYGMDGYRIDLEDRILAHLQLVIVSKLRRNESFTFTWSTSADSGSGRTSIWLAPSIPIRFEYAGGHPARINRHWLELLSATAATVRGLHLVDEPEATPGEPEL